MNTAKTQPMTPIHVPVRDAPVVMTITTERGNIEAWVDHDRSAPTAYARFSGVSGVDVPEGMDPAVICTYTIERRAGDPSHRWRGGPRSTLQGAGFTSSHHAADLRRAATAALAMVGVR